MPHFISGLDEVCLQSDANGDMEVFGSMTKKKHKAMVADRSAFVSSFKMSYYITSFISKITLLPLFSQWREHYYCSYHNSSREKWSNNYFC
jgi:hypothetical protein